MIAVSSEIWILFPFLQAAERYKVTGVTAASVAISVEFVGMCWSPRGFSPPFVKLIFRFFKGHDNGQNTFNYPFCANIIVYTADNNCHV